MEAAEGDKRYCKNRKSCRKCGDACSEQGVKCSQCRRWTHRTCVPIDITVMEQVHNGVVKFFCASCATICGDFDYRSSLQRSRRSIHGSRSSLMSAVTSERCMMNVYGARLPLHVGRMDDVMVDMVSVEILRMSQSSVLEQSLPTVVYGDGNCLFRAVSLALYGSQEYHLCLRLLTFIELVEHRDWYDVRSPQYHRTLQLTKRDTSSYTRLLDAAASAGACCEMMHVLALSSVIQKPIQSFCPSSQQFSPHPYTMKVVGRDVTDNGNDNPPVVVMWTSVIVPRTMKEFMPNHFVCLLPRVISTGAANDDSNRVDCSPRSNSGNDAPILDSQQCNTKNDHLTNEDANLFPAETSFLPDVASEGRLTLGSVSDIEPSDEDYVANERSSIVGSVSDIDPSDEDCVTRTSAVGSVTDVDLSDEDAATEFSSSGGGSDAYCASDDDSETLSTGKLQRLPNGKRLDTDSVIALLQQAHGKLPENIPPGKKDNTYLLIDNSRNMCLKAQGKRLTFADDRGAWTTAASAMPRTMYIADEQGSWRRVFLKTGRYCVEHNHARKLYTYTELAPQPAASDVIVLRHYYSKLTTAPGVYQRRVSWLEGGPVALVEYTGVFPGHEPHGNATVNKTNYRRTAPATLEAIGRQTGLRTAKQVFNQLQEDCPAGSGPRNLSQVHSKMSAVRREHNPVQSSSTINIADGIINVLNMLHTDDFVQLVLGDKDVTPSVILYFPMQLHQIKQLCFNRHASSVLTVDTTFNLTRGMYVTTTVYKHLSLTNIRSGEAPVFLGPVFIHSNLTAISYGTFFHHLATQLGDCDFSDLTVGSDDDAALRKALSREFPGASQVVCSRHIKQNVERHLRDEVNLGPDSAKRRRDIVSSLFGTAGFSSTDDLTQFDRNADLAVTSIKSKLQCVDQATSTGFIAYLRDRVIPLLRQNAASKRPGWTSNNVESVHHVLKSFNNWRLHKLPDLVRTIKGVVSVQQRQFEQAMYGEGDYVLKADIARKFRCSYDEWVSMTHKQRDHQMRGACRQSGCSVIATSTDGHLTVTASPAAGKKVNQRKRIRNVRTVSAPKTRRLH